MSKVAKEPDFAKLGFRTIGFLGRKVPKRPFVVYITLSQVDRPGTYTFALTKDGRSLVKWGKDTVLPNLYDFQVIEQGRIKWRLWFWWRRWRRKLGV